MALTDASASESPETGEAEGGPSGFFGRKKMVILLAGVLTLVAMFGGLAAAIGPSGLVSALLGSSKSEAPAHGAAAEQGAAGDHGGAAATEAPEILPMDELVVNISGMTASGQPTTRFLKMNLDMVYAGSAANKALMEKKKPYLRDAILTYLRQLSEDDLRGSDGLLLLKAELLKRARAVVGNDAPQEFLISELVMQ